MRLTPEEIMVIRDTTHRIFGPQASVRLFGSRVDDRLRGGDIDLLIESPIPVPDALNRSLEMVARLQQRLGDRPIDILVLDPETPRQPIHEQALRHGIRL